jgi:shikimate kinase
MKQYTRIVLMGMKHTGKSTLGSLLAEKLALPFFDTDDVIAALAGKSARQLYDEGGAELMMKWETTACKRLVAAEFPGMDKGRCVIATGGGIADNREALEILANGGLCVYVDTPFDILFSRIMVSAERDGRLPRFLQGPDPESKFREIYARRSGTYATMADVRIETGERNPRELIRELMDIIL